MLEIDQYQVFFRFLKILGVTDKTLENKQEYQNVLEYTQYILFGVEHWLD